MRKTAFALLAMLAGCAADKLDDAGPDFGPEESIKDDSLHYPARVVSLPVGEIKIASLTARDRYLGFVFEGKKGQTIDAYLDGLDGLDTVLYLYRATQGGRVFGRALAWNDDSDGSWAVRGNAAPNPASSAIRNFKLYETRRYMLVATSYRQSERGRAEIVVKPRAAELSDEQILEIAKAYAFEGVDPSYQTRVFASEAEAYDYVSVAGGVAWLAYDGAGNKFVSGRNDLWSQRFEIDRASGEITITAEH